MNRERVGLIAALLLTGLLATMILCPRGGPGAAVLALLRHAIGWNAGDAEPSPWSKPPGDPSEHVVVTGSGTSYWTPSETISAQDSIPVSVIVDIGPGADTATVIIGADSIPIALDCEIDGPILPFRAWGEAAFDGPSVLYGGGASWEPLRLWGASAGPGLCAGDGWFAPVARVSRPVYSTLNAGAEAGWRFQRGPDEIHLGVSVGFSF